MLQQLKNIYKIGYNFKVWDNKYVVHLVLCILRMVPIIQHTASANILNKVVFSLKDGAYYLIWHRPDSIYLNVRCKMLDVRNTKHCALPYTAIR
jgi:hypothetical protein